MNNYGLIGKKLSHSFSKEFFNHKFKKLKLSNYSYKNFELDNISSIRELIVKNNLLGLNVTIPYKKKILKYVDELDYYAKEIGAVNTLKIVNKKILGYNTDALGFEKTLIPIIEDKKSALVLGNGGASKAIQFVLKKNNIKFKVVSRNGKKIYEDICENDINENLIIINTTPLGMYPDIKSFPKIPYHFLSKKHIAYDLVYNPRETIFLKKAKEKGCLYISGFKMLVEQANFAWKIWENNFH